MGLLTLLDSRNHRWTQFPTIVSRVALSFFDNRFLLNEKEFRIGIENMDTRVSTINTEARIILTEGQGNRILAVEFEPRTVIIENPMRLVL